MNESVACCLDEPGSHPDTALFIGDVSPHRLPCIVPSGTESVMFIFSQMWY